MTDKANFGNFYLQASENLSMFQGLVQKHIQTRLFLRATQLRKEDAAKKKK